MKALARMTLLPIFLALLVTGAVISLVPQFRELFEAFGTELPLLTRALLAGYWGVLVLPLFAIAGCSITENGSRARAKVVIVSLLISWVVLTIAVLAVYWPVFAFEASGA